MYNSKSVDFLRGIDAIKKRPGMYIGDIYDGSGLHQMAYEIIDNSIDELTSGLCNKVVLLLHDNIITVYDNGRGIPAGIHKEGISSSELIMTRLHTGCKFNSRSYKFSGGLHGVGLSVVNALSDFMILQVNLHGYKYILIFRCGKKIKEYYKIYKTDRRGTKIVFLPSNLFFLNIKFDFLKIKNKLTELSCLNHNIIILFLRYTKNDITYHQLSHNYGLLDFMKYISGKNSHQCIHIKKQLQEITFYLCCQWNDNTSGDIIHTFTNNIKQKNGGVHLTSLKSGITRAFHKYIKKFFFKNKNINTCVIPEDIRNGMIAILSIYIPNPKFSSQIKDKLINSDIRSTLESSIMYSLYDWLEANPQKSKIIILQMLNSASIRNITKINKHSINKNGNIKNMLSNLKFIPCQEKHYFRKELFLVEGDSAGGSAKQGRNRKNQAILSLKGKILNVEKARVHKMLLSEEICSLISLIRCSIDNGLSKYGKIIIMTDADIDGLHIKTLLLTFFFRYAFSIIKRGHLYIAQPPLYKIIYNYQYIYVNSNKELQIFLRFFIQSYFIHLGCAKMSNMIAFYDIVYNCCSLYKAPVYIVEALFFNNYNKIEKYLSITNTKKQATLIKGCKNIMISIKDSIYVIPLYVFKKYRYMRFQDIKIKVNRGVIIYKGCYINNLSLYKYIISIFQLIKKMFYIQRFKGLGEMNAAQLWDTTLSPQQRTLLKIEIKNIYNAREIFSILMGGNVFPRRSFIIDNILKVSVT